MGNRFESSVKKVGGGLRNVLGLILPTNEGHFFSDPAFEGVEYNGPRYDDPIQLAEVATRLGRHEQAAQYLAQSRARVVPAQS